MSVISIAPYILQGFTSPVKTELNMKNHDRFLLTPNPVPLNASITVQFPVVPFSADSYYITNDSGQLIRKGKITDAARELSLSIGGMPDGIYWLVMGECRERFTIV